VENEEIICGECGRNRATVHLTDFVDGKPVERHLCEKCYAEREGGTVPRSIFSQLLAAVAPTLAEMGARQCPACGISYLEFRHGFKLGCQNDYEVFEQPLEQLLEQIHGATRHCGKVPPGSGGNEAIRSRIRLLRRRQERAVADEKYELAAQLRDRIKELQKHGLDEPAE
jgi:protein arginine kinase activator